jgi:hypothetical protein
LALEAVGGVDTVLGNELQRLTAELHTAQTTEQFRAPLSALKDYLKDIQ